jgi:cytoskeleton-associated protein 5
LSSIGDIGQILKARVTDTNKAVQLLALDIVSRIATGMGKPFEKHSRLFVVPVATVLSDQKANIRTAALQTLSSIATACEGLDSMVHGLGTALETTNPVQKSSVLNWVTEWFKSHEMPSHLDLTSWTSVIVSSLDDRNGDVRKGAQVVLPILIASAGFDHVMHQTNSLKPASRASAVPFIQAARATMPSVAPTSTTAKPPKLVTVASTNGSSSPPPQSPKPASPMPSALPSTVTGVRKQLPQSSFSQPQPRSETPVEAGSTRLVSKIGSLKKPGVAAPPPKSAASFSPASHMPFTSANLDAKKGRLAKDASRWINEGGTTRKDLADLLQHQMEPYLSKELVALLFSHDHNAVNDHIAGLTMITDFYASVQAGDDKFGLSISDLHNICVANSDLALKYASIKGHEPQSNLMGKNLDMVEAMLSFFQSIHYQFTDAEALCFIPTMVYKVITICPRQSHSWLNSFRSLAMPVNLFVFEFRVLCKLLRKFMLIAVSSNFYLSMVYSLKLQRRVKAPSTNLQIYSRSSA